PARLGRPRFNDRHAAGPPIPRPAPQRGPGAVAGTAARAWGEPRDRRRVRLGAERPSFQLRTVRQQPGDAPPDVTPLVAPAGRRRRQLGGHRLGGPLRAQGAARPRPAGAGEVEQAVGATWGKQGVQGEEQPPGAAAEGDKLRIPLAGGTLPPRERTTWGKQGVQGEEQPPG